MGRGRAASVVLIGRSEAMKHSREESGLDLGKVPVTYIRWIGFQRERPEAAVWRTARGRN